MSDFNYYTPTPDEGQQVAGVAAAAIFIISTVGLFAFLSYMVL